MNLHHALLPFLVGIGNTSFVSSSSSSSSMNAKDDRFTSVSIDAVVHDIRESISGLDSSNTNSYNAKGMDALVAETQNMKASQLRMMTARKRLKNIHSTSKLRNQDQADSIVEARPSSVEGTDTSTDIDYGHLRYSSSNNNNNNDIRSAATTERKASIDTFSPYWISSSEDTYYAGGMNNDDASSSSTTITPPGSFSEYNAAVVDTPTNEGDEYEVGVGFGVRVGIDSHDDTSARILQSSQETYCSNFCDASTRPTITKEGTALAVMITDCISIGGECPTYLNYGTTPIGCWNVSGVSNMMQAFNNDSILGNLKQHRLNCWDTSNVTTMSQMFRQAGSFNQALNYWDVSKVTDMGNMFELARSFNRALNDWNVSSVTTMASMFERAAAFNQCLYSWAEKTPPTVDVQFMLSGTGCFDPNPLPDVGPWCQGAAQGCPPTPEPTQSPTTSPTASPTASPTLSPTASPTVSPTESPTAAPTTASPTVSPTASPTGSPTVSPTASPTASPTLSPTASPTVTRTESPTATPTAIPTASPTVSPTASPTASPTGSPTATPTASPTASPTTSPTAFSPTASPTESPTATPTASPTASPTMSPTASPTASPTQAPVPTISPAPTCTPCEDDPKFVFTYNSKKKGPQNKGGCDHVAKKPKKRCKKFMGDPPIKIKFSCPVTCNACPACP